MACKGLLSYKATLPDEIRKYIIKEPIGYSESIYGKVREHVVCKFEYTKCPKKRLKCRITQYCYCYNEELDERKCGQKTI